MALEPHPQDRFRTQAAGEKSTVHYAIAANLVIALVKAVAAVVSGSAALVAETAHSLADTGNQVLLRVSLSKAERPPDEEHPFGYGRERFFWALLVAVTMFVLGALASIGEGLLAIFVGGETTYAIAYVVLAIALVAETVSLVRAVLELRAGAVREGWPFNRYLRRSTDPTVRTVLFEDTAGIVGVLVAAAGIAAHQVTGARMWEGVASIAIGLLLGWLAVILGRNSKNLIIGQPADAEERATIEQTVVRQPEVERLRQLRTVHLGPDHLFVAVDLQFKSEITAAEIERAARRMESELRAAVPDVGDVLLDLAGKAEESMPASGESADRRTRAAG
jgi:cation diffusion facilitator family transporter